jgi:hypothetical protein
VVLRGIPPHEQHLRDGEVGTWPRLDDAPPLPRATHFGVLIHHRKGGKFKVGKMRTGFNFSIVELGKDGDGEKRRSIAHAWGTLVLGSSEMRAA